LNIFLIYNEFVKVQLKNKDYFEEIYKIRIILLKFRDIII